MLFAWMYHTVMYCKEIFKYIGLVCLNYRPELGHKFTLTHSEYRIMPVAVRLCRQEIIGVISQIATAVHIICSDNSYSTSSD